MAPRRFTAERYSNCADCEDLIEPGDPAGFVEEVRGAVCSSCFDYHVEAEFWLYVHDHETYENDK